MKALRIISIVVAVWVYALLPRPADAQNTGHVILLGDSNTWQNPNNPGTPTRWPQLVDWGSLEVLNKAYGGVPLWHWHPDLGSYANHRAAFDGAWVIIMLGGGDAQDGHSTVEFEADLRAIVTALHEDGAERLLLIVPPPMHELPIEQREQLKKYSPILRAYGDYRYADWMETADVGSLLEFPEHYDVPDGLHLNDAGFQLIADQVQPYVVPEPAAWVLQVAALGVLVAWRRS